jgi:hypothetical protein
MRTRRILVVALGVLAAGLLVTPPASAGNWEETLLDPTPNRIEAGVTYTFGYWVLQHGSYPYEQGKGDLGPTALRARDVMDDNGDDVVDFAGTPTKTPGHYSAEVVFPHDGHWMLESVHETLMPDVNIATVTVPGSVAIAPSEVKQRAPYEWGPVHPSFPPPADTAEAVAPQPPPGAETRDVAPRSQATADTAGTDLPVWLVVVAGVATIALAVLLARRYRRAASR